jgi:broad specificity phosphatase PhoE
LRRLALICHASTTATRLAAFPVDEPAAPKALDGATLPARLRKPAQCWTSPALRATQTAQALALNATIEPQLRDCDYGRWAGRTLTDIERDEGDAMAQWLGDPAAAPHGGESIAELIARVGIWLAGLDAHSGQLVAVTHQSVIRAALLHALGAPPTTFWRIDVPPLAIVELKGDGTRWTLAFRDGV